MQIQSRTKKATPKRKKKKKKKKKKKHPPSQITMLNWQLVISILKILNVFRYHEFCTSKLKACIYIKIINKQIKLTDLDRCLGENKIKSTVLWIFVVIYVSVKVFLLTAELSWVSYKWRVFTLARSNTVFVAHASSY